MTFSKTYLLTLPYIFMGLGLLLLNIFFTVGYINTGEIFMLGIYSIDLMFIVFYNPLTKIYITTDSIIQKGLFSKKQIYFHQIRQVSLVSAWGSSKFIKSEDITLPRTVIYQICVMRIQLKDPPNGDYNISGKDYILFDYRPEAYKALIHTSS